MKNREARALWSFMKDNRKLYIWAVLAVGIATLFAYAGPLVLRTTIDSIIGDEPLPAWAGWIVRHTGGDERLTRMLWLPGIIILFLTSINGVFTYWSGKWKAVSSENIAARLRDRLYDHIQRLPFDYHVNAETGDLIQRCTSDVETIRRFISIQLAEVGRAFFMLAAALPVMITLNRNLTLVSVAVVPVLVAFSYFFFKNVQQAFKRADEAEGRLSTVLQENLTGVRVVRAFARQRFEIDKFKERNREYHDLTYKLIRILALYWSSSDFLSLLQIAAIVTLGSFWAVNGEITIGVLVVFLQYEWMLLWPIRQMGRIIADMGKAMVAAGRIQDVFDRPLEEMNSSGITPRIRGGITFENVSFDYNENRQILSDISFEVEPGMTVAVLGPTGSGKTTLVHLLARLYDPTKGRILIDGHDLREFDKQWLRRSIGYVLQEPFLYAKSVGENIRLAKSKAEEFQVVEAAKVAAVHDVILGFNKGYETLVGERGVTLSGGQKQRVAIARALIAESPILIFDDSLSAVDTETDAAIRNALLERSRHTTTFIISHRLTTLQEADKLLVLEEGRLAEQGTHEELLKREGLYKRLWELQTTMQDEFAHSDPGRIKRPVPGQKRK